MKFENLLPNNEFFSFSWITQLRTEFKFQQLHCIFIKFALMTDFRNSIVKFIIGGNEVFINFMQIYLTLNLIRINLILLYKIYVTFIAFMIHLLKIFLFYRYYKIWPHFAHMSLTFSYGKVENFTEFCGFWTNKKQFIKFWRFCSINCENYFVLKCGKIIKNFDLNLRCFIKWKLLPLNLKNVVINLK